MPHKKFAITVASLVAAAGVTVGGGSLAFADGTAAPTAPSSTSSAAPSGSATSGTQTKGQHQKLTVVTGDEATKVTGAVQAKDAGFTAKRVAKKADGSYVVVGTSGGKNVRYAVSADLGTVTQQQLPKAGQHPDVTQVTGDELTSVTNAVKAKDSGITVRRAVKKADGSYLVQGTSGGKHVAYTVSSDLKTVTVVTHTGGHKGEGGKGHGRKSQGGQSGSSSTAPSGSASSAPSGSASASPAPATPSASPSK